MFNIVCQQRSGYKLDLNIVQQTLFSKQEAISFDDLLSFMINKIICLKRLWLTICELNDSVADKKLEIPEDLEEILKLPNHQKVFRN